QAAREAARQANVASQAQTAHEVLQQTVQKRLSHCEHQNQTLFHDPVPKAADLEDVLSTHRTTVKDDLPFELPAMTEDPFARLVPPAVRAHARRLVEQVDERVRDARAEADAAQDQWRQFLTEQDLPSSLLAVLSGEKRDASDQEDTVPKDLWQQLEKLRQQGGVQNVLSLVDKVGQLVRQTSTSIETARGMLDDEARADAAMRSQFGARWDAVPSSDLPQRRDYLTQLNSLHESVNDAFLTKEAVGSDQQ
ncbi:MAG: hypothetical protein MHM6MM_009453, partial [Cercozoa sp. M6MM]